MTGAGKDQVTEMVIEMAAMGSVLEQAHLKMTKTQSWVPEELSMMAKKKSNCGVVVIRPLRDPGISQDPGIELKSRSRDVGNSNKTMILKTFITF